MSELSVKVERFELLSKSVRPMPDKWHGITDPDTRFRQRYADLIVRDTARHIARLRPAVMSSLRASFATRDFIEVETPMLQTMHGGAAARLRRSA